MFPKLFWFSDFKQKRVSIAHAQVELTGGVFCHFIVPKIEHDKFALKKREKKFQLIDQNSRVSFYWGEGDKKHKNIPRFQ
jgi:hypothetical protein